MLAGGRGTYKADYIAPSDRKHKSFVGVNSTSGLQRDGGVEFSLPTKSLKRPLKSRQ